MWGVIAIAAASSIYAEQQAMRFKEPTFIKQFSPVPGPPAICKSAKCPCCGSRQFVIHQSRRVCSYCRSEQDGQTPMTSDLLAFRQSLAAQRADHYYNRLGMLYGSSALRPELAVRIVGEP